MINRNYSIIIRKLFLIIILFLTLFSLLDNIYKPQIINTVGETIFLNDTKYQEQGEYNFIVIFKKERFLQMHSNKVTVFLTSNKNYVTVNFPQWINNEQLLIAKNINSNLYFNQSVLIIGETETLLNFIWNNFTT